MVRPCSITPLVPRFQEALFHACRCDDIALLRVQVQLLGQPEQNGSRKGNFVGNNFMTKRWLELYEEYFNLKVVNCSGQTLDPEKPRVLCYHPHGLVPYTAVFLSHLNCWQEQFPGVYIQPLAHMAMHVVPAMRDVIQAYGAREASSENFRAALKDNKTVLVAPGGVAEIPFARQQNDLVIVTRHKGFVREALSNNASLLPCLNLGEHEILGQVEGKEGGPLDKLHKWSHKAFGFPLPFLPMDKIGSPVTFIPKKKQVVILVGPELKYEIKGSKPTQEEIDLVHKQYFASVRKMFDENAEQVGFGHYNLVFHEEQEAQSRL